ncbi:MAG: peptide synthetase [Oscillospiraceae bacterium]|nr:peptide synthetase [Oscillospiraceae bacterium]
MKELNLNGAVVQTYPLTAAQRVHYYTVSACGRDELLNIATGFYIEFDDVDFDTLRECIYDGYNKFESMRLRIVKDEEGNPVQFIAPTEDREIKLVDFSSWREEDAHEEMKRWSRIPLYMNGGPMNEIVMIRLPGGYNGLYMKVHHMTMDSSAIISFYSYVLNLYCFKKFENIEAPKSPKSYLAQLKLDLAYEAGSPALERDRKFWLEKLEEPEPIYTPFSPRNRLLELREQMGNPNLRSCYATGDIEADIKVYDLEDEPSKQLLEFSRNYRIPVASILLLGLRTTFSKFAGGEKDVSVKNAVARRGTLLESQSGGTRIHFWPLRTVIEPETTFLDALKIIQAKENALLRHANYDPIRYMAETAEHYKCPQGTGYECTTLTYQPMSAASLKGHAIPDMNFKSMWYSNGVAMQHIYITVMHRPTDNGFGFHFEYEKNSVSLDEIEKLYYYLCRAIFRGIQNPDITIGEILEWM